MKIIKKILLVLLSIIVLGVSVFVIFLGLAQILEYRPKPSLVLENMGIPLESEPPAELSLLSWNLGYCGLDADTDFVLEGGELSRARSKSAVRENLSGILGFLDQNPADIFFLQEVDRKSHRSFRVDQVAALEDAYSTYSAWYGINYNAFFVPFPLFSPIGDVTSGLLSLSKFPATEARRLQLPGQYSWPVRLFHLKRCMLVIHFPSPKADKDWYLIQLHLSAYDRDGSLRKRQLDFVKDYILKLAGLGHLVVIGGDWNSFFPGIEKDSFGPYRTN